MKTKPTLDEPTFYEKLFDRSPQRVYQCSQCKGPYFSISYHLLYKCSKASSSEGIFSGINREVSRSENQQRPTQTDTPSERSEEIFGSPSQDEPPIKDPPEVMPGLYRKDSHDRTTASKEVAQRKSREEHLATQGAEERPSAEPPHRDAGTEAVGVGAEDSGKPILVPVEQSTQVRKSTPEARVPHWWHWCKKVSHEQCCKVKSHEMVPYTPSLAARKRSIPSIACGLYSAVWGAALSYQSLQSAAPEYYQACKVAHGADKAKIENHIKLLAFCGLDEERVRHIGRGWWLVVLADGRLPLWKVAAYKQLKLLGYDLANGEPDGSYESKAESLAGFVEAEGAKG